MNTIWEAYDIAIMGALRVAIRGPPPTWRRPPGRPRQTWTRTLEADLRPLKSHYIPLGAGHRTALLGRNYSRGQLRPAQGHATDDDDDDMSPTHVQSI